MAQSIKFGGNNYMDAEGVYDHTLGKTQAEVNSRFKTYEYGNLTFDGNNHGQISIPASAIPLTAKLVTPYFSGYGTSSQLDISFSVIHSGNDWVIGYLNPNASFTAYLVVWYVE